MSPAPTLGRLPTPLALAPLLLLVACSAPPDFQPCMDIDCSGHGRCTLVEGDTPEAPPAPTCVCDSGYLPTTSGWVCVPATDTSLCAGVTCSGHGSCVSYRGAARCVCDEGYTLGQDPATCDDTCATVDCGQGGTCERTPEGPRCRCPAGSYPTLEGLACEAGPGPYAVYLFTMAEYPDWPLGQATVDFSGAAQGELVEVMRLTFRMDYYGRGLYRTTRQAWTLDASGDAVTKATIEDRLTQGKIGRRRQATFSIASAGQGYGFDGVLQRGAKTVAVKGSSERNAPLPMLGAFEYPGWTFGCFSPAFYMLLLRNVDLDESAEQTVDVLHPTTGAASTVRVKVRAESTKAAPMIELGAEGVVVTYQGDLPTKIHFTANDWIWTLSPEGAPSDANLDDAPSATMVTPPVLPAADETPKTFQSADGTTLAGTLAAPHNVPGKRPAVLLLPGPFAADRDHSDQALPRSPLTLHLARHLASEGFVSLRFDPRGQGQSQGDAAKVTLAQLQADARAALAALASESTVDPTQVYLLTSGWGGLLAGELLAGGAGITPLKGYIALAPVLTKVEDALVYARTEHLAAAGFSSNFMTKQRDSVRQRIAEIRAGTYAEPLYAGIPKALAAELLDVDVLPKLTAFAGPVLLLRGDQDLEGDPVQLTAASDAAATASKQNITVTTLKGLTFHLSQGSRADLWESAVLPLELGPTAVAELEAWLAVN